MAKLASQVIWLGACYGMTAIVAKEFQRELVLNATATTAITPIFDPLLLALKQFSEEAVRDAVEAELLSFNPMSAIVWPWCPMGTCFNKNVSIAARFTYIVYFHADLAYFGIIKMLPSTKFIV